MGFHSVFKGLNNVFYRTLYNNSNINLFRDYFNYCGNFGTLELLRMFEFIKPENVKNIYIVAESIRTLV